jgi:hypothetical protein
MTIRMCILVVKSSLYNCFDFIYFEILVCKILRVNNNTFSSLCGFGFNYFSMQLMLFEKRTWI